MKNVRFIVTIPWLGNQAGTHSAIVCCYAESISQIVLSCQAYEANLSIGVFGPLSDNGDTVYGVGSGQGLIDVGCGKGKTTVTNQFKNMQPVGSRVEKCGV